MHGEYRNATNKIEEQADFIQKITDIAPDIISVLELPSRNILYCNNENLALHGFSRYQLAQMSLEERNNLIHPEDRAVLNKYFGSFSAETGDEDIQTARYKAINSSGEMLTFYVRGKIFERNKDGSVRSILNVIQNITETERAQGEIIRLNHELAKKATDKYLSLFNSIDEGFVISELLYNDAGDAVDLVVLETNPSFERMMQTTGTVGKRAREIFPDVEDSWFELYARVVEKGESLRFEKYLAPLDSWFELYVSRVGVEGSRCFAIVFNDITERKKAEERQAYLLRLSDALRPHSDTLAIQSVAADLLGKHLEVNQCHYGEIIGDYVHIHHSNANGLTPMIGKFPHNDFGKRSRDGFHAGGVQVCSNSTTDPILSETERAMLATGNVGAFITVPLMKEGEWVATLAVHSIEPREWRPGEVELVQETAERTWAAVERAKAEGEMQELLRQKDEFISITSHELKTPLTSIQAYADLIEESLEESGDTKNAALIKKLNTQVGRLTTLITVLLDANRIEEGRLVYHKERFNLCGLVAARAEEMRVIAGNRSIVSHTGGCPQVFADYERIGQVLTNLLSNAIKYSPDGTEIKISCKADEHEVTISVADKGIGISEQHAEKIFDRFYRVSGHSLSTYPGMGLGLYISSEIVKNHGGTMRLHSKEGAGSVFTFTLPFGSE